MFQVEVTLPNTEVVFSTILSCSKNHNYLKSFLRHNYVFVVTNGCELDLLMNKTEDFSKQMFVVVYMPFCLFSLYPMFQNLHLKFWQFLKKLNTNCYNPAILFLCIYLRELKTCVHKTCT